MLRMYLWPWIFMILLIIIKLELRWKTMHSIARINHMSCLSTMTADIRSISSFKTTSISIIHCFWLITKNFSLLVCTNRTNHMLLRTNMIRWKILWGINNFGHDKYSNQRSQIRALIPYYENKEKSKDEQKTWEWKYYYENKEKNKDEQKTWEWIYALCFSVYFIQNKELNIYKYCTHSRYS